VSPAPGPLEAFYASPLQHPVLLWAAAGAALAWCAARRGLAPGLRRFCLALGALSLLDAWLTADRVLGVGALPGAAARAVPLFFVLAGDFRFLLLLGAATAEGGVSFRARRVLAAAGLTLVVPLASRAVVAALPGDLSGEPRVLFLVYEVAFALLTLLLLRRHPGLERAPWLAPVGRFVLLYYALWASADAILLATGSDPGFGLRVVPNLLYYGGFIAAVAAAAPRAGSAAE
jgi:hypothetical protein